MRVVQMDPSSTPSRERVRPAPLPQAAPAMLPKATFDFRHFKSDDWILLGIIAALVLEGSDDYLLICALGYLFLMGL